MRIYELNPILDGDILGSQVLALDDSTQTRKISLDQIRVFLGVGENSTLIPTGTDIHVYFLTAKSGSYYGEGLLNTAHGGAWAAFDWTTHDQGRGTLTETNNVNELAVHSLAAGAWTKKKIISEAGGVFTGAITVNSDSHALTVKNKTALSPLYVYGRQSDNSEWWRVGGDSGNNNVTLLNFKAGGAGVTVKEDSSILLATLSGKPVITTSNYEVSAQTGSGSFDGQYNVKAPYYHEFTNAAPSSYHPLWKIKDLHNKNMWSGGVLVNAGDFRIIHDTDAGTGLGFAFKKDGTFVPSSYANFDARYYTQSGANAKFVQGIQLGARVAYNANKGDGQETNADAGHCLTGVSTTHANEGAGELINIYAKPIQRNINGSWATISG